MKRSDKIHYSRLLILVEVIVFVIWGVLAAFVDLLAIGGAFAARSYTLLLITTASLILPAGIGYIAYQLNRIRNFDEEKLISKATVLCGVGIVTIIVGLLSFSGIAFLAAVSLIVTFVFLDSLRKRENEASYKDESDDKEKES